ncbi:MAG TPA: TPM domain-containing protein, partial [Acidisarcina sp.]
MICFLLALAFFALVVSPRAHAERVEDLPKPSNYVSDLAGVLSDDTQQQLNSYCAEIDHQAHAQIAVVTVKTLDGDDPADYAVKLEEAWKVGPKGSDHGVIFLLAVNDHKDRIEVGYGLEGILPDGKTGDMLRGIVPNLRAADYDGAVGTVVTQLGQTIAADAGVTLQQPMAQREAPQERQAGIPFGRLIFYGIIFLVFIVFASRARGGGILGFLLGMFLGGGGRGGFGGGGFGGGGFGGGGGDSGGGGFGGF